MARRLRFGDGNNAIATRPPVRRWEGIIGFSAKIIGDAPALRDSMDRKFTVPVSYGDSHGEADKKISFGDSPFPYSVCDHLGINII